MTTYKEIFGKYVKNYSSDPTADAEGQVWYNTTSGTFKTNVNIGGAWASGGNMGTARTVLGGAGTQTAGLAFGGRTSPTSPTVTTATEEYDGSAWTAGGAMSAAKDTGVGTAGTQTAGSAFGGSPVPTSNHQIYNGTSWTTSTSMGTARYRLGGLGTQSSLLAVGGNDVGGTPTTATEEWNGAAWTAGGTTPANTQKGNSQFGCVGTQTAGLVFGAASSAPGFTYTTNSSEYDGTSFSEGGTTPSATQFVGNGLQTAALGYGGGPANLTTINYNGTTWGTSASLATSGNGSASAINSPSTTGLMFGGWTPAINAVTQEYQDPTIATRTITTS